MEELIDICEKTKAAKPFMQKLSTEEKNKLLILLSEELINEKDIIIAANRIDIENATENGMSKGNIDRLTLTESRIADMAQGVREVAGLEDPIGEVLSMKKRPNGLMIGKKRVPLGVIAMIYEARPNVTVDAFSLCFKTGNCCILKGGSDAINSNIALVKVIKKVLCGQGINPDCVFLIQSTDRSVVGNLLKMNGYIDVAIPRGGAGLINYVVTNSTVPVIETGTGNCHVYVDESADFDMALNIIENAKTQRISVCNACESLLVHEKIADKFIPLVTKRLMDKSVEIHGDEKVQALSTGIIPATEEDYKTEYLDYKISVKVVSDLTEAINHINKYNTGHSETIVTNDYNNANRFLDEIDAACVYVNASTRFTDGHEFGFGAEIGISTQKLHARGPMGLTELTTTKYIIYGNGQIRK